MVLRRRRASSERTGTATDLLVVGLGNPGDQYHGTRHNAGAEVVELLADRHGGRLTSSRQAALADELRIGELGVAVAFPQTFMNRSGESVRSLVKRHGVTDLSRLVVVHDELDLEPGTIKVKLGGGLAGHNGLKSIRDHLKSTDFARVRVGIGRPPGQGNVADFVLKRPGKADRVEIDIAIETAADAIEMLASSDIDNVMNRYNQ